MGTSQSALARLGSGELDARLSTLERYAAALGRTVDWQVRPPERLLEIAVAECGQDVERLADDMRAGRVLSAEEARAYGIADAG